MNKAPSRSSILIAAMHLAALKALASSPNGQLQKSALLQAIEAAVSLDEWALDVYETGNTRWRSIFAFASVGLVKGGYVTKSRGVWTITDEGRSVVSSPCDAPAFLAEVKKRYQAWKSNQLTVEADDASKSSMEDEDDSIPEPPELRMAAIQNQANEALSAA